MGSLINYKVSDHYTSPTSFLHLPFVLHITKKMKVFSYSIFFTSLLYYFLCVCVHTGVCICVKRQTILDSFALPSSRYLSGNRPRVLKCLKGTEEQTEKMRRDNKTLISPVLPKPFCLANFW